MNTPFNFNNKIFYLLANSAEGTVNRDTVFKYRQDGDLVTADYSGGTIRHGSIIARLKGDQLHMLYQCLTVDGELKAGSAIAEITVSEAGKLKLQLAWEWLNGDKQSGVSTYVEA